MESLNGVVERITFHSTETGFCVLRIKATSRKDLVTLVGSVVTVTPGESVAATGIWVNDKKHGLQFKAERIEVLKANSIENIEKCLASGMVKGVGPYFAKVLIKAFGANIFEIIENYPDRLLEVEGIGKKRREIIINGWNDRKNVREIMLFLQSHGVGTSRALRIHKTYGDNAIEIIKNNPYRLAEDIYGIGFKTADLVASSLGIAKDSETRVCAGLEYVLEDSADDGSCALFKKDLIENSVSLLDVNEELVKKAIKITESDGRIVVEKLGKDEILKKKLIKNKASVLIDFESANDTKPPLTNSNSQNEEIKLAPSDKITNNANDFEGSEVEQESEIVFLKKFYNLEKYLAKHIKRISEGSVSWKILNRQAAIRLSEKESKIKLSVSQKQAIETVLSSKITVITGGPGVGKTTIVNCIIKILVKKNVKILLCSPTGRAAKRLSEVTKFPAKTIHRLLEYSQSDIGFKKNANNPLNVDLLIVDEVSMLDVTLANRLFAALPNEASILLIGDVDQLPSVSPGAVLRDLILSEKVKTVFLTEIFRQAKHSYIIINAHRINEGKYPFTKSNKDVLSDFYFVDADTPEEIKDKLLNLVQNRIPLRFKFNSMQDIQVLTPMNKGLIGAHSLNAELQSRLNAKRFPSIFKYGFNFAVGDKIIQKVNDYDKDVYNGDIGYIKNIDEKEGEVVITFDNRDVCYDVNELDEIALAYAITIHKSQGSEYKAVVIPVHMQHYQMLARNLIYTGVTRASKLVVLIGQIKALGVAIHRDGAKTRLTRLEKRIVNEFESKTISI